MGKLTEFIIEIYMPLPPEGWDQSRVLPLPVKTLLVNSMNPLTL